MPARHDKKQSEVNSQKKITVMHLINSYSLAGAENLVFDLVTKMDKGKFTILLCSIGNGKKEVKDKICTGMKANEINTLSLNKPPCKKRLSSILKLHRFLKENQVDILHSHCPSPDFYGKFAAFLARIPLVFSTIHNVQGYSALHENILNHLTTRYVAISETVKQYATSQLKISPTKIEVIYNAVDIDKFTGISVDRKLLLKKLGIPDGRKIVTTIGRVTEQKGHSYLIEAAEEVLKELPNVHFLIVGDELAQPDLSKDLKKKVKTKKLQDNILFAGVRTDIPEILSITDIFVLPSLWEGLPVALLETMAAGIPIIATSVGSNPEIVTDGVNGFLVPPRDSFTLEKRIKELLFDTERTRRIGAQGKKTIRKSFAINLMVHGYEQLYFKSIQEQNEMTV